MSGISFSNVPNNIRVPGSYVEVNKAQATQGLTTSQKILVVGQRQSSGTVSELTPVQVTSYSQAQTYFGVGSMLALMLKSVFANNSTNEVWAVAQNDVSGGTAATGTLVFTAGTVLAGTISLYLGGVLVPVSVTAGMTGPQIATAVAAAINALTSLPVTALASSSTVTVTYVHKGLAGNSFDMRFNYLGALAGEVLPSGVTCVITALSGGATNPSVADVFAVLPDVVYAYMVFAYTDATNLNAIDTELNSRWLSTQMLEGHAFVATQGTVSTVGTLGLSRNSQYMSLFDCGNGSPTQPYQWASAVAGQVALAADADPGRPFGSLPLNGVLAAPLATQRVWIDQQTLLGQGVATHTVAKSGQVTIQRLITCYQLDTAGNADRTYFDANTVFLLSAMRQELVQTFSNNFQRYKLADDGVAIPANQATVTPSTIKAQIVSLGMSWANKNWLQNLDNFVTTLVVQRNANDPTRVDCVLAPTLINQLQVFAASLQFNL